MNPLDEFVGEFTPSSRLRFRQGVISSVQAGRTLTITIAGSTTAVSGVRYLASMTPVPGANVWVVSDGSDLWALGSLGTATSTIAPRVYRTTDQTLTTAVDTAVTWEADANDNAGMWVVGAPTVLTCVVPGIYTATANVRFAANGTGFRAAWIERNATTTLARADIIASAAASPTRFTVAAPAFNLAIGDTVRLMVSQNSGGNLALSVTAETWTPSLSVQYIGP